MTRISTSVNTRKRRKRILQISRGFFGNKSRLFRYAKDSIIRAKKYSYRDRKKRRSVYRRSWITKINQHLRLYGFKYSTLICKLKESKLKINRCALYQLLWKNPIIFKFLIINIFNFN